MTYDKQEAATTSTAVTRGRYLTVGLNRIDPAAYGTSGELAACENDARDMAAILSQASFTGSTLLTEQATSSAVLAKIAGAAAELQPGDIFVLTISCHGGQVGDATGDEEDGFDETWCLFDRQILDDELYAMWSNFRPGVRIAVFSDSCHSGTVTRQLLREMDNPALKTAFKAFTRDAGVVQRLQALDRAPDDSIPAGRPRALPFNVCWRNYLNYRQTYDSLQILARTSLRSGVGATVLLISGCQDDQLSLDGQQNGAFTEQLKQVWNCGFDGNYMSFKDAIRANLPESQVPNYSLEGAANEAFEAQRPFTI